MSRLALEVIPAVVATAVQSEDYWFLIGGQAVRCFVPYRPTHDVDFGVSKPSQLKRLLGRLGEAGKIDLIEKSADTIHLTFEGVDISIFLLPELAAHAENQALTVNGLLATKAHAILDRGTRRDFFDLYVLLETHRMGFSDVLRALTEVYGEPVNQGLMLRALGYFEDAATEAPLPGEGRGDFKVVQEFFQRALGALVVPPRQGLKIQAKSSLAPRPPRAKKTVVDPKKKRS